jgi:hypothetical protein
MNKNANNKKVIETPVVAVKEKEVEKRKLISKRKSNSKTWMLI